MNGDINQFIDCLWQCASYFGQAMLILLGALLVFVIISAMSEPKDPDKEGK